MIRRPCRNPSYGQLRGDGSVTCRCVYTTCLISGLLPASILLQKLLAKFVDGPQHSSPADCDFRYLLRANRANTERLYAGADVLGRLFLIQWLNGHPARNSLL